MARAALSFEAIRSDAILYPRVLFDVVPELRGSLIFFVAPHFPICILMTGDLGNATAIPYVQFNSTCNYRFGNQSNNTVRLLLRHRIAVTA